MSHETFLSWDEAQQLMLPPNCAMLIPPPPDPALLEQITAGAPEQRPNWLDDAYQTNPDQAENVIDQEANRAAAERAEYGPPEMRLLANLIAMNALLEYAQSREHGEDEEKRPKSAELEPEKK